MFALDFAEPFQLGFELVEHESDHPRGFVVGMTDFGEDGVECFFFAGDFLLQEFLSASDLLSENTGAGLPGKSYPSEEWRPIALCCPVFAFECVAESVSAFGGGLENAAVGAGSGIFGFAGANQSDGRQLFERVVNLRARDCRPFANVPPLQFEIDLIAVHRALGDQTEDYEIRCRHC